MGISCKKAPLEAMAGTESRYLGDDQIFLIFLNLRVVGEIGRGELKKMEMAHLEQKFPHFFIYKSCVGQRSWTGRWPEAASQSKYRLAS